MLTVQQYLENNHNKTKSHIVLKTPQEKLEGEELNFNDYPNLTMIDLRNLPQVNKIIIDNCPLLKSIIYSEKKKLLPK